MEVIETDPAVPMARVAAESDGLLNGFGTIHGGAIFALADQAFGLAANLAGESEVAVSASIKYLAPAKGRIEAVARRVDENEYASVYLVQVYEGKRLIAFFQGTGYKVAQTPRNR
jgi:acyl-CoA thioesterase